MSYTKYIRGSTTISIERLVGVKINRQADTGIDFIHLGDNLLMLYPGVLETLSLAIEAHVEAQKAGKAAAEKLTDAEAKDYIDKHTHTQDAEDWDAEKADAEAL